MAVGGARAAYQVGVLKAVAQIRRDFDNFAIVNDIRSIAGKDLDITKENEQYNARKTLHTEAREAGAHYFGTVDDAAVLALAVAAMWRDVLGTRVRLRNEEWKVYLESRDQKQFQVVRAAWIGDYNDANTFMDFHLSDVGPINTPGYASAAYDELVKGAALEKDMTRKRAVQRDTARVRLPSKSAAGSK